MSSHQVRGEYSSGIEVNGTMAVFKDFAHVAIRPSHIKYDCGGRDRHQGCENADL